MSTRSQNSCCLLCAHDGCGGVCRWQEGGVVAAAHAFNTPPLLVPCPPSSNPPPPLHPSPSHHHGWPVDVVLSQQLSAAGGPYMQVVPQKGDGSVCGGGVSVCGGGAFAAHATRTQTAFPPDPPPPLVIDTIKLAEPDLSDARGHGSPDVSAGSLPPAGCGEVEHGATAAGGARGAVCGVW